LPYPGPGGGDVGPGLLGEGCERVEGKVDGLVCQAPGDREARVRGRAAEQGLECEARAVRLGVGPVEIGLRPCQVELALGEVALWDVAAPPADGIRGQETAEDIAPFQRDGPQRVREQDVIEPLAHAEDDLSRDVREDQPSRRRAAPGRPGAKDALWSEVDGRRHGLLERCAGNDRVRRIGKRPRDALLGARRVDLQLRENEVGVLSQGGRENTVQRPSRGLLRPRRPGGQQQHDRPAEATHDFRGFISARPADVATASSG